MIIAPPRFCPSAGRVSLPTGEARIDHGRDGNGPGGRLFRAAAADPAGCAEHRRDDLCRGDRRRRAGARLPLRGVLLDLVRAPLALMLGAVAMLAGRIGAFHLLATPDLVPQAFVHAAALGADLGIATILLVLLGWSFDMTGGLRRVALIAGFCGMMVAEPMLYAQAPALFAALTSEDFVQVSMARETYLSDVLAAL